MKELEILNELSIWLKNYFSNSRLLIERDVKIKLGKEYQKRMIDLILIQSKSNILHTFEIKGHIDSSTVNSIIWQVDSLYGNYKWLVIKREDKKNIPLEKLKQRGLGLIVFNSSYSKNSINYIENDNFPSKFEIELPAQYIDGNLLKYYPSIEKNWSEKKKHGC